MDLTQPNPANYRIPFALNDFNGMPYRYLGRSGLRASNMGLGAWKFGFPATGDGARTDARGAWQILDRAIELGVTFWDTANRYNDASGNSERVIGQWFKQNPDQRRNVVLASKVVGGMDGRTPNHCGASRANILDATAASLQRLQLDYIDILYLHRFDSATPAEETLAAIEDLVVRGWIRYFAVSNFTVAQIKLFQDAESRTSCRCRAIAVQNKFDILGGESAGHAGALEYAAAGQLSFIAYSPLGRGWLTGRYLDPAKIGPGDRLYDEKSLDGFNAAGNQDKIIALREIACAGGITTAQLVLAYMLTLPGMGPCIPAVSSIAQLEANAAAGKLILPPEQIRRIREICGPGGMPAGGATAS